MIDYDQFVAPFFNVIVDISGMATRNRVANNLFVLIKEHFALSEPRALIFCGEPNVKVMALKLDPNRVKLLHTFLTSPDLAWTFEESNGRFVFTLQ